MSNSASSSPAHASSPMSSRAPPIVSASSDSASPPPPIRRAGRPAPLPATTTPLQRQLSLSDPNLRSCFICLLNSNETPDTRWVNPCPCTLEAHEDCLLRWVAETEANASPTKKKLRCPACNGRIVVVEPWDSVVRLRDGLNRVYGRVSPFVLLTLVAGMGAAGSAFYGWFAMTAFAGPHKTVQWLGLHRALYTSSYMTRFMFSCKFSLLHLIAPGLLLNRALPSLVSLFTVPASLVYGATLVARDTMPTWPPSPAWALTLMPYVNLSYNSVYWEFFGSMERRLNRALRGRPVGEEGAARAPAMQVNGDRGGEDEHEELGLGAAIWRLGHAVLNMFDGEDEMMAEGEDGGVGEIRLELELAIGEEDDDQTDTGTTTTPTDLPALLPSEESTAEGQQDTADPKLPAAETEDVQADHSAPQVQPEVPLAPEAAVPPPAAEPAVPFPAEQEQNIPQAAEDNNRTTPSLLDVVNAMVTQLMFPFVSAGFGAALHHALPRSWVTRSPNRAPGLLQEQWGRSLVAGCMFVVMKDAFKLYSKYRRVEVRKHRQVLDLGRRRDRVGPA